MDLETFKNIVRLSKEWTIEGLDLIGMKIDFQYILRKKLGKSYGRRICNK